MSKLRLILLGITCIAGATAIGQNDYADTRKQMVETQLQLRGINDVATLSAMLNVPRHEFVPENIVQLAYSDRALAIGNGQTISQPFIVAFMTQELDLRSTDRVLEIGTGSGYQAAVLAKIVDSVYTIEIIEDLALSAEQRLHRLGYDNVVVRSGDGYHGWPSKAPFDAIMVTAGAETIPQPLIDQLKITGRIIIPVGPNNSVRQLVKLTKRKNKIVTKNLMPVRFVPFTRNKENKK